MMQRRREERGGAEGGVGAWDKVLQKDVPQPTVREVFQVRKGKLTREVRTRLGGYEGYL